MIVAMLEGKHAIAVKRALSPELRLAFVRALGESKWGYQYLGPQPAPKTIVLRHDGRTILWNHLVQSGYLTIFGAEVARLCKGPEL